MRLLRWPLVVMTGLCIGLTLYESAFGYPVRWGVVVTGVAISLAGIWLTAVWDDVYEPERHDPR